MDYKLPAAGPSFALHLAVIAIAWLIKPVMAIGGLIVKD